MKIEITGRQVEITPALREFSEEKLAKLERLLVGPVEAHVVLSISKHRHIAEVQVKSKTVSLAGTEETDDLYASIREAAEKLERQALKHKEKVRDHRDRKTPRDPAIAAGIDEAAASSGEPPETPATRIVQSRRYRARPMSPEDAVLELEGSDDELLVFRETSSDRLQVLYRQKDGNLGLIEPEG
jgi:putative sigma-54 modulation protein